MKHIFLIAAILFTVSVSIAQEITIEIPVLTAPSIGETIDVPVTITGAGTEGIPISACDLNITYSTGSLTYSGLVNFSPLAVSTEWVFNGLNGTVYANWAEPTYTTTVAFPDGTILFYIRFVYNGGSSPLNFTKNEFYNASYFLAPTIPINGAVNAAVTTKTLNLTGVMLEGLYAGGGLLNSAKDDVGGDQFPGFADQITVELHDGSDYSNILHSADILLSNTGSASVTDIPASLGGDYYITIRHRNSIVTVSAEAVSFAGSTISQSFASPADVFGSNLQLMPDSGYAIFGGDVNQDGAVDTSDMTDVDNDAANYAAGYLPSDVDGNGATDTSDMTIVDNNSGFYIGAVTP